MGRSLPFDVTSFDFLRQRLTVVGGELVVRDPFVLVTTDSSCLDAAPSARR
jgi:hypothetical protein